MKDGILRPPLNLTLEETYPYLGMRTDKGITPDLTKRIQKSVEQIRLKAHPRCLYMTVPVKEFTPDRVSLEGSDLVIAGEKTAAHFQSSSQVSLFAVTIGDEIDTLLSAQSEDKSVQVLLLDGVASAAAENIAEQADAILSRDIRRQGFFPTARFSPGYGDWPLSWQKPFIESVQGIRIGISVTPQFLLHPVKSITAVIGWSKIPVERNYETPSRTLPCRGTMSCRLCPLAGQCINGNHA